MALPIEKLSEGAENFESISSTLGDIKTVNLDMLSSIKDIANSLKEQTKIELKEIKKDDKKEQIEKVKEDVKDDAKKDKEKTGFFARAAGGAAAGQAALGSNLALGGLLAGSLVVTIFDSIKEMIEKEGFFGTIKIGLEKFNSFFQDLTGINIAENLKKFNTWFSELTGINLGQSLNTFVTTLQGIKLEDLKTNFDTLVTGLGEAKRSFENITGINFSEETDGVKSSINGLKEKLASITVEDLVKTIKEFTDILAHIVVKLKPFVENWEATLAGLASAAAISMGVKKAVEIAAQRMMIKSAVTSALKGQTTLPLTEKETVKAAEKGVRKAVKPKHLNRGIGTTDSNSKPTDSNSKPTDSNSKPTDSNSKPTDSNSTTTDKSKNQTGGRGGKGYLATALQFLPDAYEKFTGVKAPEWTNSFIDAADGASQVAGTFALAAKVVGVPTAVALGVTYAGITEPTRNLSLLENVINKIKEAFITYDKITLDPKSFKRKKSMLDSIDAELSQAKQLVISLKNTGNRGLDADMKKKKDMLIQRYEDYVKRYNTEEKVLVEWNKTLSKEDQVDLGKTEQRIQAREAKSYSSLGGAQAVTGMTTKERKRLLRAALKLDTTISPDIDDTSGPPGFKSMLGFAASSAFETQGEKYELDLAEKIAENKEKGRLTLFSAEDRAQMKLDEQTKELEKINKTLSDYAFEDKKANITIIKGGDTVVNDNKVTNLNNSQRVSYSGSTFGVPY